MNITPPSGVPPTDLDNQAVEPTAPTRETRPVLPSPSSQSVQLKLSPNMFQLGQVLDLIVAKMDRDNVLLLMQNKIFDKDGQPLKLQFTVPRAPNNEVGQRITAQVTDLKDNLPKLNVIATQKPQVSINNLLVQAQTKQQPLQQLLDGYAQVTNKENINSALPREVNERIQTLWRALPESGQIQRANALKHGIQNSGPFLESQLLKASMTETQFFPATDTKTNLLRIAEAIRHQLHTPSPTQTRGTTTTPSPITQNPAQTNTTAKQPGLPPNVNMAPPQARIDPDIPVPSPRLHASLGNLMGDQILELLLQQTEGSLQRTLAQQLLMLNNDNPRQQLIVELPIRNGQEGVDVFDLRIHPDQEQNAGAEQETEATTWTVMMSFNLDGLGPVRAQVSFANGQVSTNWWAEQADTVDLFKNNIEVLQSRLTHVGAEVSKLNCQHGLPKIQETQANPLYSDSFLDEQT